MLRTRLNFCLFAIRDAFITLLPLTFFRVLVELVRHFPIPAYHRMMTDLFGAGWEQIIDHVIDASVAAWGVGTVIAIAVYTHQHLSRLSPEQETLPTIMVGFSGLMNFMLYVYLSETTLAEGFGYGAMTASIVIGLGTGILLDYVSRWQISWPRHLTYDTDLVFSGAIQACLPTVIAALVMLAVFMVEPLTVQPDLLLSPLQALEGAFGGGVWWFSIGASLVNQVTWFFGAHGGLALDTISDNLFAAPGAAYSSALGFRPLFDTFILLGGAGSTLGLLIAIVLTVREGGQFRVARLALFPSLFNINEIVLFGLPVVLNPLYLVPFIGVPVLLTLLTVGAVECGVITFVDTAVPWTTPPLISGWMITGSWHGAAFQLFEIALSTALYLPFVRIAERRRIGRQSSLVSEAASAIMEETKRSPVIRRRDDVGLVARVLLGDLKEAIKRGDLKLHYQPKLDRHETVVGFEALLRWTHHRHGSLSPILAVTLAEDGGMINELGSWVIDEACACKARWNALGYKELTMALNISPMQLTDADLPESVARALIRNGLSASEIELEITESQAIPDNQQVDDAFRRLMEIGVRLTMDDFGMGYSSLLYLRRFDVGAIKIDGSLSREVLTHKANADIIRSIAVLGETRGVSIIAEFVETERQRDALIDLGCTQLQGYLFSRALPEAECVQYLHTRREFGKPEQNANSDTPVNS